MNLLSLGPPRVRTHPNWEMAQSAKRVWPTADEPAKKEDDDDEEGEEEEEEEEEIYLHAKYFLEKRPTA